MPVFVSTKPLSDQGLPPTTCQILTCKEGSLVEGRWPWRYPDSSATVYTASPGILDPREEITTILRSVCYCLPNDTLLHHARLESSAKPLFQPPDLATLCCANPVAASNIHESSVIRRCNQCKSDAGFTPQALTYDVVPRLMDIFKPSNPWVAYWYTIILNARLSCRRSCRTLAANSVLLKADGLLTA